MPVPTLDLHTHILPERWPDLAERYGCGGWMRLDHPEVGQIESGLVMYPLGHAQADFLMTTDVLEHKINQLVSLGVKKPMELIEKITKLSTASPEEVRTLYDFEIDWKTG
mgnify:CR=1 FL=1